MCRVIQFLFYFLSPLYFISCDCFISFLSVLYQVPTPHERRVLRCVGLHDCIWEVVAAALAGQSSVSSEKFIHTFIWGWWKRGSLFRIHLEESGKKMASNAALCDDDNMGPVRTAGRTCLHSRSLLPVSLRFLFISFIDIGFIFHGLFLYFIWFRSNMTELAIRFGAVFIFAAEILIIFKYKDYKQHYNLYTTISMVILLELLITTYTFIIGRPVSNSDDRKISFLDWK